MKPTIFTSEQELLRAVSNDETGYGMFVVSKINTGHQIGIIDAENGSFKPTHTDTYLSIGVLTDLTSLLIFLQPRYSD